jgi:hypothetical protein
LHRRWRLEPDKACEASDLPVPAEIVTMIRGWQAWYEYDYPSRITPRADIKAQAAFGLFIALPDWTVVYHDDNKAGNDLPRDQFEYEIILKQDRTFSPWCGKPLKDEDIRQGTKTRECRS